MAKVTKAEYIRPASVEAHNEYIEILRPYAEAGEDTAFKVEFDSHADYRATKLKIQKAMNTLGFTARQVATTFTEDGDPEAPVESTFLVRPARKAKGDAENA